jgi:sodium-dependent dicarboxylate transporter 2/3/5
LASGAAAELIARELARLGGWQRGEKRVAFVFLGTAALWIAGDALRPLCGRALALGWPDLRLGAKHYEATVAMLAALVLIATRTVSLAALKKVPWSTLLLLGGSFAMASGIEGSGLSSWMARRLAALADLPLLVQIGLARLATVALSAVASNSATLNVMLNVLPQTPGVLSASVIASSCDFMLPAGTPPNAIVYASGLIPMITMIRVGLIFDLLGIVVIWGMLRLVGPG